MNEQTEKRTWEEILKALEETHTTSIRDACMMLKASRPWVNRYIKPHVDALYLNSGRRGDSQMGRNWVKLAAIMLDREDMTESIWLHTGELLGLLSRSMVSVTKQTKNVPVSSLIAGEDRKAEYCARRAELLQQAKELARKLAPEAQAKCLELYQRADLLHLEYVDSAAAKLLEHTCSVTTRGKVERVDVPYPGKIDPERWIAPHDIKAYGDTDEAVFRYFFRSGSIRLELSIPDEDGVVSSKVYYINDPDPLPSAGEGDKIVIVAEAAWRKYKEVRGD